MVGMDVTWWDWDGSERGLVGAHAGRAPRVGSRGGTATAGCRGRGGPWVVGGSGLTRLAAALGGPTAGVAAPAALAAGAVDLGGRELQGRADLLDVDLEDGALLALAGLIAARLEAAVDDDPHAALERLRDV